jgi:hypothetical protein
MITYSNPADNIHACLSSVSFILPMYFTCRIIIQIYLIYFFTNKILFYSQNVSVIRLPSSGGYQVLNGNLQYMDLEVIHVDNLNIVIKIYSYFKLVLCWDSLIQLALRYSPANVASCCVIPYKTILFLLCLYHIMRYCCIDSSEAWDGILNILCTYILNPPLVFSLFLKMIILWPKNVGYIMVIDK